MKEIEKSKIEESLDGLFENRIVRVGLIIVVSLGAIYVAGRLFSTVGKTVASFKEMTDSFKN